MNSRLNCIKILTGTGYEQDINCIKILTVTGYELYQHINCIKILATLEILTLSGN